MVKEKTHKKNVVSQNAKIKQKINIVKSFQTKSMGRRDDAKEVDQRREEKIPN